MNKIEPGMVLDVAMNDIHINSDYELSINRIPIGKISKENLTHFPFLPLDTLVPAESIKQIVFIKDYEWGVKHVVDPIDEFNSQSLFIKAQLLEKLIELTTTRTKCSQQ